MTDFDSTKIQQQAFGTPAQSTVADNAPDKIQDLNGTEKHLDLGQNERGAQPPSEQRAATSKAKKAQKSTATMPISAGKPKPVTEGDYLNSDQKDGKRWLEPILKIDRAIEIGATNTTVNRLLKHWTSFNLQEARTAAKKKTEALVKATEKARRKIADELLALADAYGCSMEEAKAIYTKALKAKFDDKVLGK